MLLWSSWLDVFCLSVSHVELVQCWNSSRSTGSPCLQLCIDWHWLNQFLNFTVIEFSGVRVQDPVALLDRMYIHLHIRWDGWVISVFHSFHCSLSLSSYLELHLLTLESSSNSDGVLYLCEIACAHNAAGNVAPKVFPVVVWVTKSNPVYSHTGWTGEISEAPLQAYDFSVY